MKQGKTHTWDIRNAAAFFIRARNTALVMVIIRIKSFRNLSKGYERIILCKHHLLLLRSNSISS